jgi:alpha-L-rhamnosidase
MLNTGKNAIGAMVGNGWFRGTLGWTNNTNIYGDQLALLFQLHVEYTDGSQAVFTSDQNWKSGYGAIQSSEIYDGEEIDARMYKKGWAEVGFDDSKWSSVRVLNQGYAHLLATYNEPVRKHETFSNPKYLVTPKGEKVLDFGQNLVGWVKVRKSGKAGDSIIIKHAEVLDKAGNFYTENMRAAKTTAKYILSGNGVEEFEPHFTFYGFRYIKIEGINEDIDPSQFTAVTLYSDMDPVGTFTSSNPLINQLQHNIQWGQRGNFLDVPTDCPQRDERLGWTGDAQAFSRTATFNFRTHSFFTKWLRDVEADQLPTGSVPHVIPNVLGKTAAGSAGWADVATIIPWDLYLVYGDKRVLETQFNSMKNWVRFMEENAKNDLWNVGFHFGDWLFYRPFDDNDGRAAVTDKYLIAQCFYAHSTQLLINAAEVLGKKEELEYHQNRLKKIKEAFVREYVTPSGRLVSGTQTAYVLALNFDMLPEILRIPTADRLEENIRSYGNHLSTGFLGTPYLCEVLTRFGKTDMAFKLLMQETFPSWLYPVKMGATTIWERWSGIRPDGSFEPAGMNSFNHYAYGAIGDWMYRRVAGIDNADGTAGYKKLRIEPNIGGGLTQASGTFKTYYGDIESSWKLEGKRLIMRVRIPANTNASVYVPSLQNITINGKALDQDSVLPRSVVGGKTIVQLGSGTYEVAADMQ